MSPKRLESRDHGVIDRGDWLDLFSRVKQAISTATRHDRAGTAAMLAAGILIARAVRARSRNRRRAAGQLLVGAILFGVGVRQRRSSGRTPASERTAGAADGGTKVSDEAHAAREQPDVMHQSEPNPRGTAADAAVEAGTEADEGSIRFTEEPDADSQEAPRLDDAPEDPRYADESGVEVDLSQTALADEASEATGPDPEQAQPTQTEDTEPESSPPEDASHVEAEVTGGTDPSSGPDADRDDDGAEPGENAREERTDSGDDESGSGG